MSQWRKLGVGAADPCAVVRSIQGNYGLVPHTPAQALNPYVGGVMAKTLRQLVLERDSGLCAMCGADNDPPVASRTTPSHIQTCDIF